MLKRALLLVVIFAALGAGSLVFAAAKISGKVVNASGEPVPDAVVKLEPVEPGEATLETKTKKKGQYFFAMVDGGNYTLHVTAAGLRVSAVDMFIRDKENKKVFDFKGPLQPGAKMPEFSVADTDTMTYDLTLQPSSAGSGEFGTGIAVMGTGDLVSMVQKGDAAKARKEIGRTLEITPNDPRLLYLAAFLDMQDGKDADAEAEINKALAAADTFPGARLLRGAILEKRGDNETALADYRKEAETAQDSGLKRDAYIRVALLAKKMNLEDDRLQALQKVIEVDPSNDVAFTQLLDIYLHQGKEEEVRALLASAPDSVKNDPAIQFNIGVQAWNRGNAGAAAAAFSRALELDPSLPEAHRQLGYCQVNLGNTDKALAELQRYLELAPGAPDASEVKEVINKVSKIGKAK
jgi:tetratricopeptide (TPR) repeat protein